MSADSYARVSILVARLTMVLAFFVAVVPVSIFAASIYFHVSTSLVSNLRVQAVVMENNITTRPEYWDMNPERLQASYARYVISGERFHILDKKGNTLVELGPAKSWHMLVRSQSLYDFGHEVGKIEVGRSILPEIFLGGLIFVISLFVAWLIRGPLRRLPLAALAESEQRLLRREQYQRALLDNFPFLVWLKDERQQFLAANAKLAHQLQQENADTLIGKTATQLVRDDWAQVLAVDASKVLHTGLLARQEQEISIDGRQYWFEIYQAPVFLPSGLPLGTVGYARDISESKFAEQELAQHRNHLEDLVRIRTAELSTALEAAQSVSRLKTEFVSTVSHELRTPLTAISGALGLVTGQVLGTVPPSMRPVLEIAHKNSLLLSNLINDLLDIEKLNAGKLHFDMQDCRLADVIVQSIESCAGMVAQHSASIQVENAFPLVMVRADPIRLQQVLSNFISNAAKFSQSALPIIVRVSRRQTMLRVEVIDCGLGIPEKFFGSIFQKFSQVDASDTRKKGGTGLGLAISKELIEQMHGVIGFHSEEGKGSCFYFELPELVKDSST